MEVGVYESGILHASAEAVWAVVGNFNGLPQWVPAIARSSMTVGDGTHIGNVRHLTLADGSELDEVLLERSVAARRVRYTITQSAMPLTDYHASLSVYPITISESGAPQCLVEWKTTFQVAPRLQEEMPATVSALFRSAIKRLQSDFGGPGQ
jgi:hypothetical protein